MKNVLQLSVILLCTVAMLATVTVADACPGCKDAIGDDASYNIARGYFWSILFMMSMPFLILGTFGTYIYIEVRRSRKDQQTLHNAASAETTPVGAAD